MAAFVTDHTGATIEAPDANKMVVGEPEDPLACTWSPDPMMATPGTEVKFVPADVTLTAVTVPEATVAVAVAEDPPPPESSTEAPLENPYPPIRPVNPVIDPPAIVAVTEAPVPRGVNNPLRMTVSPGLI